LIYIETLYRRLWGLAQGPYMVSRAGFKPTTFWTKGDESTNEPPHPTILIYIAGLECSKAKYPEWPAANNICRA